MASWLIGTPSERQNSRVHRQLMQERVEAKPRTTIEEIAAPLLPKAKTATLATSATQTKLNRSAIKSSHSTNEFTRAKFIC